MEPNQIFNLKEKIIYNQSKFDLILSWDENVLASCSNSQKFIFGTSWIDLKTIKLDKQNEISFLTSDKNYLPGHILRQETYQYLRFHERINDFEVLNLRSPPMIKSKNIIFEKSKYSIIIENLKTKNLITEKLIDCLVTKTIPIYYGCPNVGEFFNRDGIIEFDTLQELEQILRELTPDFYSKNQKIIEENCEKSKQFIDFHCRIKNQI